MINATDFKQGTIFKDNEGQILEVISYLHHRKSQAKAVIRVKLKNLETSAITEKSYRPEDKVEQVSVEKKPCSYLYTDKGIAHFMDSETYEQFEISLEKIKNVHRFFKENMQVEGLYLNGIFFTVEIPIKIKMKVASTVPGVKGDSVSNVTKPATLENGMEIKVPLFINEGDEIIIDTRTGEYVQRV